MNGSEGLLGIITEITVKLTPKPELARVVMAAYDSVRDCANAAAKIIKAGIIPAGLEMMDKSAIEAAEGFAQVGYPLDAQALLLCELDGTEAQVQTELDKEIGEDEATLLDEYAQIIDEFSAKYYVNGVNVAIDRVLVVDDPISSLDSNVLFIGGNYADFCAI
ncbi:MAG: hypothetical protein A6F72_05940 [Cycloclasticus sp. symbiont of Poecilosclerida sp. N]|nr:MAG: hypothetical protein A6F72_05940 [Cycloclasticus sp. symbiont of Poecilosclerida sp. N]